MENDTAAKAQDSDFVKFNLVDAHPVRYVLFFPPKSREAILSIYEVLLVRLHKLEVVWIFESILETLYAWHSQFHNAIVVQCSFSLEANFQQLLELGRCVIL